MNVASIGGPSEIKRLRPTHRPTVAFAMKKETLVVVPIMKMADSTYHPRCKKLLTDLRILGGKMTSFTSRLQSMTGNSWLGQSSSTYLSAFVRWIGCW